MSDYFLKCLQNWGSRLRGLGKTKKKNLILGTLVLILGMGIFFNPENQKSSCVGDGNVGLERSYDLVNNIKNWFFGSGAGAFFKSAFAKKKTENLGKIMGDIDPLNKIGQGMEIKKCEGKKETCKDGKNKESSSFLSGKISELVSNHPLEKMAVWIGRKNENVASFLVAIAKKESNWGLHSPKKNGRDCFNYWGYRGTYNQTNSGYSCFDSPEQAVDVVGGRIEELISQGINTPEKMLVWKCGSSCASHNPQDVRKWVADVSMYLNKLN